MSHTLQSRDVGCGGQENAHKTAPPAIGGARNSPGWTRTSNLAVNSRSLYQLSYRGSDWAEYHYSGFGCNGHEKRAGGELHTCRGRGVGLRLAIGVCRPTIWGFAGTTVGSRSDQDLPDETTMKDGIHPEYYPEAKVFFRGEQVMTVGATVPELNVEIWSGSHPFFTGKSSFVDTAGRVEKFQKKYQGDYFKKKK